MARKNDATMHAVRRAAIDILQAGNYLEDHKPGKALKNIGETITTLEQLLRLIKRVE